MMNRRAFPVFLAVVLILIVSSFTVSAQQTRAVPSNDSFSAPIPIKVGKNAVVPDIGAATNEAGEPIASCKGGTVIPHTVWFTVSVPLSSVVSLSTFGSILHTSQSYGIDTVLAVYDRTAPMTFTEIACNDDMNGTTAAQLVFTALGGKTYYIAAGTFGMGPFLPDSTLKLSTRMLSSTILPPNYDFESPITDPGWTVKNGDNDQIECSNPAYPAANNVCTFRFTGTPGRTTKLIHTTPFQPVFVPRKNAIMTNLFYFRIMDLPALTNTKVKFLVTYRDGTPPSAITWNLSGTAALPGYAGRSLAVTLKSGKIASIKTIVKFAEPAGTMLFDYLYYYYLADPMTRGSGLLPVPPAASEKQ
jgi:hypothetical protein